jgi:tRNA (guanine-N(1)-)-methyltransferase
MKISILTLFPEMFENFVSSSIIKRAIDSKLVDIEIVNIRDFSHLNNKQVDDTPYGGGAGMVMRADIVLKAIESVKDDDSLIILMSPGGKTFNQNISYELSKNKHLIFVCGHYEGIDDRILKYIDMELSIGDFILTGGEIPAMAMSDSIIRLIPGVIRQESSENESFNNCLLDYPVYTRPSKFNGDEVPSVLLSGNHAKIAEWRKNEALKRTKEKRPDLLK